MRFYIFTVISFYVCVVSGQLIRFPIGYNQSTPSPRLLKRSSRSIITLNTDFGEQRCHGCQEGSSAGQCSGRKLSRVKKYMESLKCMPEPTLVELKPPGPHLSLKPSLARVKRCSGYCKHGFHTCLPTQVGFIKIPVMLTNHHNIGGTKCVEYEVEQHEACECGCEIKKEQCSERHTHERCTCKCEHELEKYQCLDEYSANTRKVWNEETCECNCEAEAEPCPMGFQWDVKNCRCEAMIAPSDLENLLY